MIYIHLRNFITFGVVNDLYQFKEFYHLDLSVIYIHLRNFITWPFWVFYFFFICTQFVGTFAE